MVKNRIKTGKELRLLKEFIPQKGPRNVSGAKTQNDYEQGSESGSFSLQSPSETGADVTVLQFTLAACPHKTLLTHHDGLVDVGLGLIEQLACQTHLRAQGVCACV